MKSSTQSKELPKFDPCPFCGKDPNPYHLADYGLVRCWDCGVRMEKKGGLEMVAKFWNRRPGKVIKPVSKAEPEAAPPIEVDSLASYITAQVGGAWYISNRAIAKAEKAGEKRIKQSDYDRYEKMFQMRRLT